MNMRNIETGKFVNCANGNQNFGRHFARPSRGNYAE